MYGLWTEKKKTLSTYEDPVLNVLHFRQNYLIFSRLFFHRVVPNTSPSIPTLPFRIWPSEGKAVHT